MGPVSFAVIEGIGSRGDALGLAGRLADGGIRVMSVVETGNGFRLVVRAEDLVRARMLIGDELTGQ